MLCLVLWGRKKNPENIVDLADKMRAKRKEIDKSRQCMLCQMNALCRNRATKGGFIGQQLQSRTVPCAGDGRSRPAGHRSTDWTQMGEQ